MKLQFAFLLCGVLVLCSNLAAAESSESADSDEEFTECTAVYLKSKGKLDIDVDTSKKSSMCIFGMHIAIRAIREVFENKLSGEMPTDVKCIMDGFDREEVFDHILKMGFVTNDKTMDETEKKTKLATMENEGEEMMKNIAKTCGVDEEKLADFMDGSLDSSEEKKEA